MANKTINIADKETLDDIKLDTTKLLTKSIDKYKDFFNNFIVTSGQNKDILTINGEGYFDLLKIRGMFITIEVDGVNIFAFGSTDINASESFILTEDKIILNGSGNVNMQFVIKEDERYKLNSINSYQSQSTFEYGNIKINPYTGICILKSPIYFKQSLKINAKTGSSSSNIFALNGGLKI